MYFVTDDELAEEVRNLLAAYDIYDDDYDDVRISDEVDDVYATLTLDECEQALDELEDQRLAIDATVRAKFSGEEAAEEAKRIRADLNKVEGKLNGRIRDIEKNAKNHLADIGADDYSLDDEGNVAVTAKMDGVISWWEQKQAELRTELELKMQATVAELRSDNINANHIVRDRMYETLVAEEVIEQWEPLEF